MTRFAMGILVALGTWLAIPVDASAEPDSNAPWFCSVLITKFRANPELAGYLPHASCTDLAEAAQRICPTLNSADGWLAAGRQVANATNMPKTGTVTFLQTSAAIYCPWQLGYIGLTRDQVLSPSH
jgi:hypothetical protein